MARMVEDEMNRIEEFKQRIAELHQRITEIQSECSHPKGATVRTPKSNAGGYEQEVDYWYDCYCTLCEKSWTEPQ